MTGSDLTVPDGAVPDGAIPDGALPDGALPDGALPDGAARDGAPAEGAAHILLVGMMGAGKTTTGKQLADRLGWDFLDSDAEVELVTGLTVPALFARDGEAVFRRIEAAALSRVCAAAEPAVISVGGGAVLRPESRALLRASGRVIWLRARPATLAARVGAGTGRPLLESKDDPEAALEALDDVRRSLYAEVAHETIDVDDLSPEAVGEQIIAGPAGRTAS